MLNLILLGVTLIILFLLFEFGLRIFGPENDPNYGFSINFFQQDDELCYKITTQYSHSIAQPEFLNDIEINSAGFRGPAANLEIQNRVLMLGDSFQFGYGVQDNETVRWHLQNRLDSEKYQVLNLGVPGYDTVLERKLLEKYAELYTPTIVIVHFFTNDIVIQNEECALLVRDGYLITPEASATPKPFHNIRVALWQNLYSYRFTSTAIHQSSIFFSGLKIFGLEQPDIPSRIAVVYQTNPSEQLLEARQKIVSEINEMQALAIEYNFTLYIAMIPDKSQLLDNFWERIEKKFGSDQITLDRNAATSEIKQNLLLNKIRIIAYAEEYEEEGISSLYYQSDSHWTAKGHEKSAAIIYKRLIKDNIIDVLE